MCWVLEILFSFILLASLLIGSVLLGGLNVLCSPPGALRKKNKLTALFCVGRIKASSDDGMLNGLNIHIHLTDGANVQ